MSAKNSLVATYASQRLAESDISKLRQAGFDSERLSVVGKGCVEGASVVAEFDALGPAVCDCIPQEDLQAFQAEAKAGRVVLVAHGTAEEIAQAQSAVATNQPINWNESAGYTVYYGCAD